MARYGALSWPDACVTLRSLSRPADEGPQGAASLPHARAGRPAAALRLIALALILLAGRAPSPARAQGQPLRFTVKTIENEAGMRVILEFTRKPVYEIRRDSRRVYLTLNEESVEPPFKKKQYGGAVLDKVKFIEGFRTSELVFYVGDDFANFSTFEMGEPFRIVLDLRKKQAPPMAVTIPGPASGASGGTQPAPGAAGRTGAPPAAPPPAPAPGGAPRGAEERPRPGFVVVIDPGHGGDDTGAQGPSGLAEKDVTLDIARRLKARVLSEMDAEVILTRDADRTMALDERTAIANHNRADLFVCIHANAARRRDLLPVLPGDRRRVAQHRRVREQHHGSRGRRAEERPPRDGPVGPGAVGVHEGVERARGE